MRSLVLDRLTTEQQNPASEKIDQLSSLEIVQLMNREDKTIADAVAKEDQSIARAVDAIVKAMTGGGRLIYMGAGTSGRLGVLDASECPPTFNTDPEQVVGLIAGGHSALVRSIEGAEDFPEYGARDLDEISVTANDVVVGIATSGRTPYVIGGLAHARGIGCPTVGLACNDGSELEAVSDIMICPVVGPEIVSGSTRMKAGTATKLILNSLTTATMIRLGKTYGNLMVDLRATNTKLKERSRRIVGMLTNLEDEQAQAQITADRRDADES
jgi:N-acetylmuramic acid 6-phosphate etherase